ncbi:MAG: PRC-barrel domain-containing protein [Candidatus Dormibacteria bacterium]
MAAHATSFQIGMEVSCSDGACGDLIRVVVDPVKRALTHLSVEPRGRLGLAKLVPVTLASVSGSALSLSCTLAEFDRLPDAEETQFLQGDEGSGYPVGQVLMWPYYGLGMGGGGGIVPAPVTYDKMPLGEVGVRRGEQVQATDGAIGSVRGLVIDPADHLVTHVLLDEGHLWGHKRVAIPISKVTAVEDGIHLSISKQEVQELPEVGLDDISG